MSNCFNCRKWLCERVTDYGDGTRIINHKSPIGKGLCEVLKIETDQSFGCIQYEHGLEHIEIMGKKPGSPWHHSRRDACPDCKGVGLIDGETACRRCARTGTVLYYDDGYIGEEQTRRHPNEVEKGPPPKPHCFNCQADIDLSWVACPHCGEKVEHPTDPVRVTETFQSGT